jgi:flagellar biosynthesis/type III secretory pathway chaperone
MDDLVAVLAAEAGEYHRLLPLLEEEERVLFRADAAALAEISARREALLVRLTRLERERRAALRRLATMFGVEPRALTVSRLIELAPGHAHALEPVREKLRDLLRYLLERNGRNRFVAERTLACLRGLFAGLVSALASGPTYTQSGRSDQRAGELRLLDRRA